MVSGQNVDTGEWQPGDTDTAQRTVAAIGAAAAAGAAGLGGRGSGPPPAGATGDGMSDGYLNVVARVLAGWDPETAAGELADMLDEAISDGAYAEALTGTEITVAAGQSALDYYMANTASGTLFRWVTEGDARVCPRCQQNAASGPVRAGQPFPSGDTRPPAHPRCRCAVIPDWA